MKHLRGHVIQGAHSGDGGLCISVDGQAKVCQLDFILLTQQQVLWLDVTVHDALQTQPLLWSADAALGLSRQTLALASDNL